MAVARAMAGSLAVGDEHARAQEALSGGLTLMAQAVVKMFRSDNGGGWQEVDKEMSVTSSAVSTTDLVSVQVQKTLPHLNPQHMLMIMRTQPTW